MDPTKRMEIGKGVEPVELALYYKKDHPTDGSVEYSSVVAWKKDRHGNFTAWAWHPTYGCEQATQKEGRLEGFTPVTVVSAIEHRTAIESLEARIAGLEALMTKFMGSEPDMAADSSDRTWDCEPCGKKYKSAGGLAHHNTTKHAAPEQAAAK